MWLATSDVTSLYTVIHHNLGLQAVKYHLDMDPHIDPRQVAFITDSIEYILNHNYFWYDQCYYLQRQGTAMGTRFAPSYANLFMSWWEDHYIWANEQVSSHLVLWRRYIDDIVFVWNGSETSFTQFTNYLNSNPLNLHFTTEFSKTKVQFLDLEISINHDKIETITFHKPVDVNNHILATSNHHPNWLASIPRGQFTRIRRNCTHHHDFMRQGTILAEQFHNKGYNRNLVQQALTSASSLDRESLLSTKDHSQDNCVAPKDNKDQILFITQFNDQANQIKRILTKHWDILLKDDQLAKHIGTKPKVVFRKAPNLHCKLVKNHIKIDPPSSWLKQTPGMHHCSNCICCKTLGYHRTKPTTQFNSTTTKLCYPIKDFITCNTKQVIYLLECPCHLQYVGRTTRSLKDRVAEHLRNIKKGYELHSVSDHFKKAHNSNPQGLTFTAIQTVKVDWRGGDLLKLINKTEMKWIYTLKTSQPYGLNIDTDLQQLIN